MKFFTILVFLSCIFAYFTAKAVEIDVVKDNVIIVKDNGAIVIIPIDKKDWQTKDSNEIVKNILLKLDK